MNSAEHFPLEKILSARALVFKFCFVFLVIPLAAQSVRADPSQTPLRWEEISPGWSFVEIDLGTGLLSIPLYLVRFNPKYFSLSVVSGAATTAESILKVEPGAVAAINGSFFDQNSRPIGLVISNERQLQGLHRGGRTLSGVLAIRTTQIEIFHRFDPLPVDTIAGLQSGPRLIAAGKALPLIDDRPSRRSGIALANDGAFILFATQLRFPGLTLQELQRTLADPRLGITDALNLDGGGSSQLSVNFPERPPLAVSGGDRVPVLLVVKKRDYGKEVEKDRPTKR